MINTTSLISVTSECGRCVFVSLFTSNFLRRRKTEMLYAANRRRTSQPVRGSEGRTQDASESLTGNCTCALRVAPPQATQIRTGCAVFPLLPLPPAPRSHPYRPEAHQACAAIACRHFLHPANSEIAHFKHCPEGRRSLVGIVYERRILFVRTENQHQVHEGTLGNAVQCRDIDLRVSPPDVHARVHRDLHRFITKHSVIGYGDRKPIAFRAA